MCPEAESTGLPEKRGLEGTIHEIRHNGVLGKISKGDLWHGSFFAGRPEAKAKAKRRGIDDKIGLVENFFQHFCIQGFDDQLNRAE